MHVFGECSVITFVVQPAPPYVAPGGNKVYNIFAPGRVYYDS
jgi:hypothetical protein